MKEVQVHQKSLTTTHWLTQRLSEAMKTQRICQRMAPNLKATILKKSKSLLSKNQINLKEERYLFKLSIL